ncbi:MAG TPA: hypothetical protein VFY93_11525 [Planctomycetota bacterium]|nr:hypothetical protein [Planctomycetota bacterium]
MMYDDRTIWRHLDGEMPEAEAKAFAEARVKDTALARRITELSEVSAAVRGGVPKPPPDFAARVVARAMKGPVAPVLPLDEARRFLRRVVVAAAILAAVGVALFAIKILPSLVETPLWAWDPLGK